MKVVMVADQVITSPANSLLKEIRRSISCGSTTVDGFAVAESFHLLTEAMRSGLEFKTVLASKKAYDSVAQFLRPRPDISLRVIEDHAFSASASTETSQGVISLVRLPHWDLDTVFGTHPLVVVLDGIQDPGNAGSIVRSAEAFGISGVVFLRRTVAASNPKTLRASAGSLFRVPFVENIGRREILAQVRQRKLVLLTTSSDAGKPLPQQDLLTPCAVVIGSEGQGVSPELRTFVQPIHIPTMGVESLNAAVSAAVIFYEAARQRGCLPRQATAHEPV